MGNCSQLAPVITQVLGANGIHQPNAPAALQAIAANETGCDQSLAPQVDTNSFFSIMSGTPIAGAHYIASNGTWTVPYNSPAESVQGFIQQMQSPLYSGVWNTFLQNGNAAQFYQGLCNQGYCGPVDKFTFPSQVSKIFNSITSSNNDGLPVIGGIESGISGVSGAIGNTAGSIASAATNPFTSFLSSHTDAFKALAVGVVGLVIVFIGGMMLTSNDVNIETVGKVAAASV